MRPIPGKSAFFHTLVIVGGSIVGCGGKAQDGSNGPTGDGDASGSGSSGSGAQTGDGDGDIPLGSGGGGILIGTGGASPGAGGAYMGGAHGLDCRPEYWACTNLPYDCSWQVHELPGNCSCDENKPLGPYNCEPGTAFTCMEGVEYDANYENARVTPFSCACLPQEETCDDQCAPLLVSYPSECSEPTDDFPGYLCGCERPVLR